MGGDALSAFNLPNSLDDEVKLLAREMTKIYKSLAFAHASLSAIKIYLSTA